MPFFGSINLVVCAGAFKQDGFFAFVLHKLEDHTQIVTGAARL
jgi:hypothetical protein